MRYLWDTNIVVYYLQRQFPENAELYIDHLLKDHIPAISVITEIELLCWKTASEKDIEVLHSFINDALIIELEPSIKLKAAELRKARRMRLPDAIIAATAIVFDLVLLSRNAADMTRMNGLKIINPWTV